MKDHFSKQASDYARFRPDYPDSLITFLLSQTAQRDSAWDCGTGNGQLAAMLAPHFKTVFATDISKEQLAQAPSIENVRYKQEAAGTSEFADQQFNLITVAQAIHWFPFNSFYADVYRCLRNDGLFAAAGYGLLHISPKVDVVIRHFYENIVGPYWDPERRHIDAEYATIPFPFKEIPVPQLVQRYQWTLAQLTGYLNTWSAVTHYSKATGVQPLDQITHELKDAWGETDTHEVAFPILLRAGRKVH